MRENKVKPVTNHHLCMMAMMTIPLHTSSHRTTPMIYVRSHLNFSNGGDRDTASVHSTTILCDIWFVSSIIHLFLILHRGNRLAYDHSRACSDNYRPCFEHHNSFPNRGAYRNQGEWEKTPFDGVVYS